MVLRRLHVENLRAFDRLEWEPRDGINVLTGANGVGKTTVLEAIHLLAHGRSFRAGGRDALTRHGAEAFSVFAEIDAGASATRRVGLLRNGAGFAARVDGRDLSSLTRLFAVFAAVCFEPQSHELISGPSELRRRFVDWGLFHVEQDFMPAWRRYQRALKQRNALLRSGAPDSEFGPWEHEMVEAGEILSRLRRAYVDELLAPLAAVAARIAVELGTPQLRFKRGWRAESTLGDALAEGRDRDRALGYTAGGPHRASWELLFEAIRSKDMYSRGQQKIAALTCVLAQARHLAQRTAQAPVVCLDDLGAELDRPHQVAVLGYLVDEAAQVVITATEPPAALNAQDIPHALFHVEQGGIRPLL